MTRRPPRHRAAPASARPRSSRPRSSRPSADRLTRQTVALALIGSAAASTAPAGAAIAAPADSELSATLAGGIQTVATQDFRTWSIERDPLAVVPAPEVVWPLGSEADITELFGPRTAPTAGASTNHRGIDLAGPVGMPVHSALAGTVITAQAFDGGGCGVYAEVAHRYEGEDIVTKYCHLQSGSLAVTVGQQLAAGDVLGRMGNTGVSTGPHLHFELIVGGVHVDPLPWLSARAGR